MEKNEHRQREVVREAPAGVAGDPGGNGNPGAGERMDLVWALIDQASALYGPPSTHLFQRQLKIGYRQAKTLVVIMEGNHG